MATRITLEHLEKMKTQEVADLLASVVLLLKRLPDVPYSQLLQQAPFDDHKSIDGEQSAPASIPSVPLTREVLAKKKVAELKLLAKEMNVLFASTTKKDDLINKILARSQNGQSEQRAMLDM